MTYEIKNNEVQITMTLDQAYNLEERLHEFTRILETRGGKSAVCDDLKDTLAAMWREMDQAGEGNILKPRGTRE